MTRVKIGNFSVCQLHQVHGGIQFCPWRDLTSEKCLKLPGIRTYAIFILPGMLPCTTQPTKGTILLYDYNYSSNNNTVNDHTNFKRWQIKDKIERVCIHLQLASIYNVVLIQFPNRNDFSQTILQETKQLSILVHQGRS